jgi:hypothetical protein
MESSASLAVRKYILGDGQAMVDKICKVCPQLQGSLAVPSRDIPTIALQSDSAAVAQQMVAWTYGAKGSPELRSWAAGLDAEWISKHSMMLSALCDEIVDDDDMGKELLCATLGRCVCSKEGKQLLRLGKRFVVAVKQFLPFRSQDRRRLADGEFFCLLRGARPDVASQSGSAGDVAEDADVLHVWHFALQYLSPFRTTWQVMAIESSGDVFELSATGVYKPEFDAYSMLDLDRRWSLRIMEVLQRARPIGEINPKRITARPFSCGLLGQEVEVWTPPRKTSRRRGRPDGLDGSDGSDDDLDDADDDGRLGDEQSDGCGEGADFDEGEDST